MVYTQDNKRGHMQKFISTIGYEGATIEAFVASLKRSAIDVIIDVRDVPLSRKKGFSKNQLAERLSVHGIRYVHLKGLGDPKEGREAARAGNYSLFQRIFAKHLRSAVATEALAYAADIVREERACLMCFEADPETCHRTIVADRLFQMTGLPVSAIFVQEGRKMQLAA